MKNILLSALVAFLVIAVPTVPVAAGGPVCEIEGTQKSETLRGTSGNDVICGKGGADRIFGGGGNDILRGGGGNDRLFGGSGDDELFGDDLEDILFGEKGDDRLEGGPRKDDLNGGPRDDRLDGGPGKDTLMYDRKGNGVSVDARSDTSTGQGFDRLLESFEYFLGTDSVDTVDVGRRCCTLVRQHGFGGADLLRGKELHGEGGDDVLRGSKLIGGRGDDQLVGTDRADSFRPGGGNDQVQGRQSLGPNHDQIDYSKAPSSVVVDLETHGQGEESDGVVRGQGQDAFTSIRVFLLSRSGDRFMGDGRKSKVVAGPGGDELFGGPKGDLLKGNLGKDIVRGQGGKDTLEGGDNADELYGGKGKDACQRGSSDEFHSCETRFK